MFEAALAADQDNRQFFVDARFTRSFLAQILSLQPNYKVVYNNNNFIVDEQLKAFRTKQSWTIGIADVECNYLFLLQHLQLDAPTGFVEPILNDDNVSDKNLRFVGPTYDKFGNVTGVSWRNLRCNNTLLKTR